MGLIVVGVDGSRDSIAALRFAIDEARLRGDDVRPVIAWHVPTSGYETAWSIPADAEGIEKVARANLTRGLEESGAPDSGIALTPAVREGQAAEVLCWEARDAELLIVGSGGPDGVGPSLPGSVSQECVHHAPCPVVVLPHRSDG